MSSEYKVNYTKILDIKPLENSNALDIATVYGFQVVIRRNSYSVNSEIFYIPIDSILPKDLENILFTEGSKITLHKSRVRQIRIRGFFSQGMIVSKEDISLLLKSRGLKNSIEFQLENDYATLLEISKYEPPQPSYSMSSGSKPRKVDGDSRFRKYNGIDNLRWFPDLFKNQEVIAQCKIHGANARASKFPFLADTLFKKLLKFLRLAPKTVNLYGSNNVQISGKLMRNSYYQSDVWGQAMKKYDVFNKMKENESLFFELYGDSIQKNYSYGCKSGEHKLILFDVRILLPDGTQKWLDPEECEAYAKERGFDFVPVLYRGIYNDQLAYELSKGPSVLCPEQKVREGIVIKKRFGYDNEQNKTALKLLNEDYLADKNNSDFQ